LAAHILLQNQLTSYVRSKWAGLAGLRVGFSIGHPDIVARMMALKQPYNVNAAADVAARAALAHMDKVLLTVEDLKYAYLVKVVFLH
jgi:histidinol-phosphate/aromatic aminotransferase/cobyric acid decarboxylase-like protein